MSGSGGASKKVKFSEADSDDDDTLEAFTQCQQEWRPNFMAVGPYKNSDERECIRSGIDISGKLPAECQVKVVQRASSSQLFVTAPASKGWLSIDRLYGGASAEEKQTSGFWNCFNAHKDLLTQMTGVKYGAKGSQQLTAVFTVPFKARDKANPFTKAIVSNADGTVFLWITIESWVEPVQAAKEDIEVEFF